MRSRRSLSARWAATFCHLADIIKGIPMIEMSAKDFRQVIDVDSKAPFIVANAFIQSMIKKGGGKIISICSMLSELGRETVSAYAAAKGGLKMLTKNIASESEVSTLSATASAGAISSKNSAIART